MLKSSYKFEFLWYYSGNSTEAVYLNKPMPARELKTRYPNLKAVRIEFGKTDFKPLRVNHDAYLADLVNTLDLEEIFIERGNRLTTIPPALWKPSLRLLSIQRSDGDPILEVTPLPSVHLEELEVDGLNCAVDPGLLCLPTLKKLHVTHVTHPLSDLHQASDLRELRLSDSSVPLSIELERLPNLESIQLTNVAFDNPTLRFSNLKKLKHLYLRTCVCMPVGIGELDALQHLDLSDIQTPSEQSFSVRFDVLDQLQRVLVKNCNVAYTHFLGEMPVLETIDLSTSITPKPQPDARLFTSEKLEWVMLTGFRLPEKLHRTQCIKKLNLSNADFAQDETFLSCFQEIEIRETSSISCFPWQRLHNLRSFSCHQAHFNGSLPDFGSSNTELQSIELRAITDAYALPDSWNQCPQLYSLDLIELPLKALPAWNGFSALKRIRILRCPDLKLRKEILLWRNLSHVYLDNDFLPDKHTYLEEVARITSDESLSDEAKLVLGALVFEGSMEVLKIDNYKQALLQSLRSRSPRFKQLVWQQIHLLNPGQKRVAIDDLRQKSIGILGKLHNSKSYYKEKLTALGCDYLPKVDSHTPVVVVGEEFDLPDNFPGKEQWFLPEVMLEQIIQESVPGYMQSLPADELHNLRKLLWSTSVENERIVVEMVKGGGVSDAIIPDLLVVAKTSKDAGVKAALKKLLKAKLNAGGQKILSHTSNIRANSLAYLLREYASYGPDIDVSQMAVTFDKRESGNFSAFFSVEAGKQNPYRQELFTQVYPQFLVRPHYVDMRWRFTSAEIAFILSHENLRNKLKRLILGNCNLAEIMPALLLHAPTLEDLQYETDEPELPQAIGEFRKLKMLAIHADAFHTLPAALLSLTKLRELRVYSDKELQLDAALKPLTEISRLYCSAGFTFE
jgi:hypothetical protein